MFTLILVDPKPEMVAEWQAAFSDFPEVSTVNGYFEDLPHFDCMVSAANSFGLMDGGVDLATTNHFGVQLERRVQRYILDHYRGEQPVGTSFVISATQDGKQFIAHTPTMRVPMVINGTDNVYLAMKAMLEAVWQHNEQNPEQKIQTVACPGLGTATGRVPLKEAARQMSLAYKNFLNPPTVINWGVAERRQREIRWGGRI